MAATVSEHRYEYKECRVVVAGGGVFDFGIATFLGSAAPQHPGATTPPNR
jgi:hypothetical protein